MPPEGGADAGAIHAPDPRIPGLSVAILRGDSVLLARGYGEANVELHVAASDSTIYQSGSLGKQFTLALVVMLAEEGRPPPPRGGTTADGSLYFTVHDLAAWAVALNHRRVPSAAGLDASWRPVRLADGSVYPYGFGWGLLPQRGYRRIGHTGSWQGFQTSIERYPGFGFTIIVLANLAGSRPDAISVAIAGILEPALTPPERLVSPPGRDAPRDPIPSLLSWMAEERQADRLTSGFRRFSSVATRGELRGVMRQAHDWSFVGCDRPRDAFDYLDARVAFICYEKGIGKGGTLATVYYDAAWRASGVELDAF